MYHNFCIHSSVNEHLGCFRVVAIVKNAATNIGVHVSVSIMVFSGYIPSRGIVGSYGSENAISMYTECPLISAKTHRLHEFAQ